MTRRTLNRWLGGITAGAAAMIQATVPAFADPPTTEQAARYRTREILHPRVGNPGEGDGWLRRSFHLQKKAGFAYTHQFETSDKPLILRIQGPVMKKQKALGLTFKIRF